MKEEKPNQCKICAQQSSGTHFGVLSCDECKQLFEHSTKNKKDYACSKDNKCIQNEPARNDCKSCFLKKCLTEGMSLTAKEADQSNAVAKRHIDDVERMDETSKKIRELTAALYLTLKISDDESLKHINLVKNNNLLNTNSNFSFDSSNLLPKTSINDDFIIFISLLKNKVFQAYKTHITESKILNNTRNRLQNGDFVAKELDINKLNMTFFEGQLENIFWLQKFIKDLPGFDKFDTDDTNVLVGSSSGFLLSFQLTEYYKSEEINVSIIKNVQYSKETMSLMFGKYFTDGVFKFHYDLNQLMLTEVEKALFYPFVISSCRDQKVRDKETLLRLREKYTRALIYEFELNNRNASFFIDLQNVFAQAHELDLLKDEKKFLTKNDFVVKFPTLKN